MKHIVKDEEPPELRNWKAQANENWQPIWDDFRGDEKRATHDAMLKEQGHICCYCLQKIERSSSHFEHIIPRSLSTEDEKLTYTNMLASCGRDDGKPENIQEHCGQLRGNKELFVSPLHHDCESRFRFYDDGMIRPVDGDNGAKQTIENLGLDYTLLIKNRKAAIIDATRDLPLLSNDEIAQRYRDFSGRSADGKFKEYCVAVQQVLSRLVTPGFLNQGNVQ